MNDTIHRRDAIQALVDTEEIKGFAYRILEDRLMEIPSADRPQGEWIAVDSYSAFGGSEEQWYAHGNPTAYHYCSVCKEQVHLDEFGEEMLTNYCPNCGAKMKGADDE